MSDRKESIATATQETMLTLGESHLTSSEQEEVLSHLLSIIARAAAKKGQHPGELLTRVMVRAANIIDQEGGALCPHCQAPHFLGTAHERD